MSLLATLGYWTKGIRLYLALATTLVTVEVWWWGSAVYAGSNLATIRIQEVYGWLSIALLAITLLIGPTMRVWPQMPGKLLVRDARRMLGIGAAWFALLHAGVAYIGQFQNSNPLQLPEEYQQALLLGVVSLVILVALAVTSFNGVMKAMGVWWFRLHRLVYVAAIAAVVHALLVGVHVTTTVSIIAISTIVAVWLVLKLRVRYTAATAAKTEKQT